MQLDAVRRTELGTLAGFDRPAPGNEPLGDHLVRLPSAFDQTEQLEQFVQFDVRCSFEGKYDLFHGLPMTASPDQLLLLEIARLSRRAFEPLFDHGDLVVQQFSLV